MADDHVFSFLDVFSFQFAKEILRYPKQFDSYVFSLKTLLNYRFSYYQNALNGTSDFFPDHVPTLCRMAPLLAILPDGLPS